MRHGDKGSMGRTKMFISEMSSDILKLRMLEYLFLLSYKSELVGQSYFGNKLLAFTYQHIYIFRFPS